MMIGRLARAQLELVTGDPVIRLLDDNSHTIGTMRITLPSTEAHRDTYKLNLAREIVRRIGGNDIPA